MIGRVLSRYTVLEEIGRGGMGVVYRARDESLGREVALKVLSATASRDDLLAEARAAAAVSHPAVAVVHDVGEAEGVTFIAMELVRGESLRTALGRGPLEPARGLALAAEVAEGLAEAHARGVVHRDLKPGNVVLSASGRAKIVDFGLARRAAPLSGIDTEGETMARRDTDVGCLVGTAPYMSPEQVRGEATDARSDVFSFGAMLHELLAGRPPFARPTALETLHAVMRSPAPRLGDVGLGPGRAEVQRILDKCLDKDPSRRYQGAADLAVDLRAACRVLERGATEPAAAEVPPAPGRLRVAVVDDEENARALLLEYLSAEADVEVVAECRNGFEAVKAAAEAKPDLVLLDVQMPKLDGFEVAELLGSGVAVVFVTAFDQHAVRAFEVNAVDYLLKPVEPERLRAALRRVRERLGRREPPPPVAPLLESTRAEGRPLDRVLVRDGARVHVIPAERIDFVEAQDDYVSLAADGKRHLKQQPLAELEKALDPARFVRVHRSYLLNLDRLARLESDGEARVAVLRDGTRLPVSRTGYQRLKTLL